MTPAALILTAMALGTAGDPAVRVCEILAKTSVRVPESFIRTAAPIFDGRTIVIEFSERDLRGREKHGTRTCTFRQSEQGFRIEALRRVYLELQLEGAKSKLARTPPGTAQQLVRSQITNIGREMFVQDERRKQAEREATSAGIYPIPANKTALK
jgi:hypothetical protein